MKEINSILIANRGEIASRIIRTCRKMGIRTIAVYSEADKDSIFVQEADAAIFIGESQPNASYLNQEKIIAAAKTSNADAIHPGYGFLSENASFAKNCIEAGFIFIGPQPEAIEKMGSKAEAKNLMDEHGVPTIPGYQGENQNEEFLIKKALEIGFPLLLKAVAGGGGKGMRIVESKNELAKAITAAKNEAQNAFGNDDLIIEKYIAAGRHIEFQIFGDQHGNVIHILERECSIQRRYQKIVEESPSPIMTEELRNEMGEAAIKAAKAINYSNAGTVEFIYDEQTAKYYFLEINTRLQVEHLVTEAITNLDLVKMQIESAAGMPLAITQDSVWPTGYAVEVRLYAEDAENNFTPAAGKITKFEYPIDEDLQVESSVKSGSVVSVYYDPMIAKLIVWGENRITAHNKMKYILSQLTCTGITTNQDFLKVLFEQNDFKNGQYNTNYLNENKGVFEALKKDNSSIHKALISATIYDWQLRENSRKLLKTLPSGWRNNFYEPQYESYSYKDQTFKVSYRKRKEDFEFTIGEQAYSVKLFESNKNKISLAIDNMRQQFTLSKREQQYHIHNEQIGNLIIKQKERLPIAEKIKEIGSYEAKMPSQIISIEVEKEQIVKIGDPLIVLSSMKMENTIYAESEGKVDEVYVEEGSNIEAGTVLIKII